jgi:hypothetical protein
LLLHRELAPKQPLSGPPAFYPPAQLSHNQSHKRVVARCGLLQKKTGSSRVPGPGLLLCALAYE